MKTTASLISVVLGVLLLFVACGSGNETEETRAETIRQIEGTLTGDLTDVAKVEVAEASGGDAMCVLPVYGKTADYFSFTCALPAEREYAVRLLDMDGDTVAVLLFPKSGLGSLHIPAFFLPAAEDPLDIGSVTVPAAVGKEGSASHLKTQ